MFTSSNDMIGFGCISLSIFDGAGCVISLDLVLEQAQHNNIKIGMNAITVRINIIPMKPDSSFSAYFNHIFNE